MPETNNISVGFVNIVATPHPVGIYARALNSISSKPVCFRGKDYAVILAPVQNAKDPELLEGVLSVWTDIDASEPSIDKATFRKQNVERELAKAFAKFGFNNRSFNYVLDSSTHTIGVELINEVGKTIAIRQVGKIFEQLFSSLNKKEETYEVTVIPSEDAIDSVLGLKRLDRVRIVLKRPNPGDHDGGDADDVLRELEEMNIRQAEYNFARQPGTDGIHLTDENQKRAEVAAFNGFVTSSGIDDDGDKQHPSTKEYPKIVKRTVKAGATFLDTVRSEVRRFRGW